MQHRKIFIPRGLSISDPFFYIIRHISSGKLYVGYKAEQKTCNSLTFMSNEGYQTSSKIIKEIINNEGLMSFEVDRIRHFSQGDIARDYESRFLNRVNAMNNPLFINQSNGGRNFILRKHTEITKREMKRTRKGFKHTIITKDKIRNANIGRKHTNVTKEKLKESHTGRKHSDITRELLRKNNINRRWWNNGYVIKFCERCPGEGWSLGKKLLHKID